MVENSRQWPPKSYRSREAAEEWLPKARAILKEIERRVPAGQFGIKEETLFVGTLVPEIVACVAVILVGIPRQLTALEFHVDGDIETTAALQAQRLLQWRARVEAEIARPKARN
ncbi:hypothetical protein E3O19_04385 [Cryobacterium algoritolerans]|uniref:Uncharacterized protein n=1 Tax=Cryobacterium algoritolerans TaxID=1259184 RepID=A0A4R8WV98_9MICO|nr:hypothetical protein [Cryobacterium algoritolerans]TFC18612.1 hypothetical protein E3O19_04385 [Cryobacterium algoritolerans]